MPTQRVGVISFVHVYSFYAGVCMAGESAERVGIRCATGGQDRELRAGFQRGELARGASYILNTCTCVGVSVWLRGIGDFFDMAWVFEGLAREDPRGRMFPGWSLRNKNWRERALLSG